MENGFSIVTCHFLSQGAGSQWRKGDNRGDNRVIIGDNRKNPGEDCHFQGKRLWERLSVMGNI